MSFALAASQFVTNQLMQQQGASIGSASNPSTILSIASQAPTGAVDQWSVMTTLQIPLAYANDASFNAPYVYGPALCSLINATSGYGVSNCTVTPASSSASALPLCVNAALGVACEALMQLQLSSNVPDPISLLKVGVLCACVVTRA
jgi:hypothetical protein